MLIYYRKKTVFEYDLECDVDFGHAVAKFKKKIRILKLSLPLLKI